MFETNSPETNLKQTTFFNGSPMAAYLLMSSRPQVERPRSKTNYTTRKNERESLWPNNLQNQSVLVASNQVNQSQDEGKQGSISGHRIESNSVLFENESNLRRKKHGPNRMNSLRASSRGLSQSPLKEFNDESDYSFNQKGDSTPVHQVLDEIRKQNQADFKNIIENKVANRNFERRLSGFMNSSTYQSRQKLSDKKLTDQISLPPSAEISFYLNARPPNKASPKKNRFQPPMRATTLDLDFGLDSSITRRRANTAQISPDKGTKFILNTASTLEQKQTDDTSSKESNLQDLKTFESLQMIPDLNNFSPSKPQFGSPQRSFSPQKRRLIDKNFSLNQSCVQEGSKGIEARSFLIRKDLNKSPMNLTDSFLGSPAKSGSPKKRCSSKQERDVELKKNRDLIKQEKVKDRMRLLETDKKFNNLLESHLDASFGKIDKTITRYQDLRSKNDTYIASIRKHY